MRGETPSVYGTAVISLVSIHSPHARGDRQADGSKRKYIISIHSPHARGDKAEQVKGDQLWTFQSTPLMRGETCLYCKQETNHIISIHSPHARGDPVEFHAYQDTVEFQSTPLMRGETIKRFRRNLFQLYFNPLPSCEGRHFRFAFHVAHVPFQSTPLMRGETIRCVIHSRAIFISIHSPHARGDPRGAAGNSVYAYFNPLPSCEGRRATDTATNYLPDDFNPLPSCEGRQHKPPKIRLDSRQFIQQNHHSSFF